MFTTILAQSDIKAQSNPSELHEYNITLVNWEERKTEQFTFSFPSCPSPEDWQNTLYGWTSIGYELACNPLRVRTINI